MPKCIQMHVCASWFSNISGGDPQSGEGEADGGGPLTKSAPGFPEVTLRHWYTTVFININGRKLR